MRKQKTETFPRGEFADRLSALCAAAANSGLSADAIAETLERHAEALRVHAAIGWVHPSAPVKYANVGGNGNLVQRLTAAIKGEYAIREE
jgi:hypothetical protein